MVLLNWRIPDDGNAILASRPTIKYTPGIKVSYSMKFVKDVFNRDPTQYAINHPKPKIVYKAGIVGPIGNLVLQKIRTGVHSFQDLLLLFNNVCVNSNGVSMVSKDTVQIYLFIIKNCVETVDDTSQTLYCSVLILDSCVQ